MATKSNIPAAVPNSDDTADPSNANGSVIVRGTEVALATNVGGEFVTDCARYREGLLSEPEIKAKWALSNEDWAGLAHNAPLLAAVRTQCERRILGGECAREAAQRHFAKAPDVLNRLLTDEQVAPRHRIEAARELRQTAAAGPDIAPGPTEKFTITINLGADETLIKEVYDRPALRQRQEDGEPS
jgi:hypothetical protein